MPARPFSSALCGTSEDERSSRRLSTVLFVCTRNSARSILAEAILNRASDRWVAWSAGSRPGNAPHADAIELLEQERHDVSALHSKSIEEAVVDACRMTGREHPFDTIVTLCDQAASEPCPVVDAAERTVHAAFVDPAGEEVGSAASVARFRRAYAEIRIWTASFDATPAFSLSHRRSLRHVSDPRTEDLWANSSRDVERRPSPHALTVPTR